MLKKLTFIAIILIASFLRLYQLGDIPRGIYIDEPSLGYNAWSILHIGKDEYGQTLPVYFKAFGEYKLPGYIYSSIPFIALFGLNSFSVRLLTALSGIAATYGIFLLTKQLFPNSKNKSNSELVALISAALFAISPWSIHFSRAAFEANFALTLIIFATYFFLKSQFSKSPHIPLIYSTLLFTLSFYTYNAARLFSPIFFLILIALYWSNKKQNLLYIIAFSILTLPSLLLSFVGEESARIKTVFELGNKYYLLGPVLGFLQKYLVHFSPDFLFFSGDLYPRHSVLEIGELYLPQLPFLILGLYLLYTQRNKTTIILTSWLLLAPIPAALATPVPHALRTILMLPPLIILTAVGISRVLEKIRNYKITTLYPLTILILTVLFSYSFLTYMHVYYVHYSNRTSYDWGEDKTLLAEYIARNNFESTKKIYVESEPNITSIYFKFFNASQQRFTNETQYTYFKDLSEIKPQTGEIVAINGWKGTPEQLTNVVELKMRNNSVGFKVGEWKE